MSKEAVKRYLRKRYKVLSVRIEKKKLKKFKQLCKDSGRSQSSVINAAITNFIKEV